MSIMLRTRVPLVVIGVAVLIWFASGADPRVATAASTDVSECPTTPVAGLVTISQDFTSSVTTCFKIGAAGVVIDGGGHTVTLTASGARLADVTSTSTAIYNNVTVQNISSNGDIYVNGDTADGFVIQNSNFHNLSIYSADNTQVLHNTLNGFILWGTGSMVSNNIIRGTGQRVVDVMGDGALGAPSFRGCPAVGNHTFTNNTIENTDPIYSADAAALTVRCSTTNTFTGNTIIGGNATSAVILKDAANSNLFDSNHLIAAGAPAGVIYFGDSSTYVPDPATNIFRNNVINGTTSPAITEMYTAGGNQFSFNVMVSGAASTATLRVDPSAAQTSPDIWDHNTIYNNAVNGTGLTIGTGVDAMNRFATHFTFTNNIVSYAGLSAYAFNGPIDWLGMSLGYNLYQDRTGTLSFGAYDFNNDGTVENIPDLVTWQTKTVSDNNSKVGDPQFSNVNANDFRLLATSPASTTGSSGTNIGAKETIPPICVPNWQCSAWSICAASGTQTRTCTDTNACGVTTGKPAESQSCTPPDTTKPIVSITAPVAGANVWGATTITANATDNVGISGVQFKVNGLNVGVEDTIAPYQTTWSVNTAGTYAITAVARDAAGNVQTSSTVTVTGVAPICTPNWQCSAWSVCSTSGSQSRTCTDANACGVTTGKPITTQACTPPDTTKPLVAITSPTAGTSLWGNTTIVANATDNVGVIGVQFQVNGMNIGTEDMTAPYQTSWTPSSEGTYNITAVARDAAGNTQTSVAITVTAVVPCTPSWQCTAWSQCSTGGQQTRTCTDLNACGVTTGKPAEVQQCLAPSTDTTPPTINNFSPSGKRPVSGTSSITVKTKDASGIEKVEFYVNGVLMATDIAAGYSTTWNTRLYLNSTAIILVRVYDRAGNVASKTVTVTIANRLNTTVSRSSTKGTVTGRLTFNIKQYGGNQITKVEYYKDKVLIGSGASIPSVFAWDTTQDKNGYHRITIKAQDALGHTVKKSYRLRVKN